MSRAEGNRGEFWPTREKKKTVNRGTTRQNPPPRRYRVELLSRTDKIGEKIFPRLRWRNRPIITAPETRCWPSHRMCRNKVVRTEIIQRGVLSESLTIITVNYIFTFKFRLFFILKFKWILKLRRKINKVVPVISISAGQWQWHGNSDDDTETATTV